MIGGPVLGLFILGIIYPWTNYKVSWTMINKTVLYRDVG